MYRTLAFHDDTGDQNEANRIYTVDHLQESRMEIFRGYKTSKRTLLVCSLILISLTGLLATWIFVARPRYYPKLNIMSRSTNYHGNGPIGKFKLNQPQSYQLRRSRRGTVNEVANKNIFGVEILKNVKEFPINNSRLPLDLIPEEYHLQLKIDLNADNFTGNVKIVLRCDHATNKIVFHGRRVVLKNAFILVSDNHKKINYSRIVYLKKYELFVIELDSDVVPGEKYELNLEYMIGYGKSLAGLYKSNYTTKGKTKSMVSTHFEPTDARSAFPCLDEPFFKAKFVISISHHKDLIALSNMPIKKTRKQEHDIVEDEFEISVRMSTYLVAFSVNDFKYKERITPSGIKVRCYAREDDYKRIDYAVEAGAKVITFYEDFFKIKYPLPKLDLLAVPDFMAGAMEDWGLVSFRSAYLIFDEKIMTVEYLRQITLVIAHELAHQWFGNLVTMKWWNDIWLNEGFANFIEMLGTNQVNPQFNALDIQATTGWQAAIATDSLNNSHPVSQNVKRTSEIDELFDAISYNKGAALLRMVQGFMGNNFIEGVKSYLKEYKYSNAETVDLWKHLSKSSNEHLNIKQIMDTWTIQRSFPVLTLSRDSSNDSKFTVTQESFVEAKSRLLEDGNETVSNSSLWRVPFTYITDESLQTKTVWLADKETKLDIDTSIGWLKANVESKGFYLVNYDNKTWYALKRQLNDNYEVFSPIDRAGIIHDVFKLACEEMLDPITPLEVTKYLSKEGDYIPWSMMRSRSECLSPLLHDKELKGKLKKYIWKLQSHLVDISMLDYSNDTVKRNLTIFERLQFMETFSYCLKHHLKKEYREKMNDLFNDLVNGKSLPGLSAEVRALSLMYGYNSSSDTHWNYLWQVYMNSEVDTDRKIVMKAFAQFKDKDKVKQILEKSLDRSTMRVQDTIPLLANIVKVGSRKQVWDFVVKNYQKFRDRYGGGYQLGQLMNEVAAGFATWKERKEVKAFLKKHPIGAKGSRTEKQILEKIRNNIRKHAEREKTKVTSNKVKEWLEQEDRR